MPQVSQQAAGVISASSPRALRANAVKVMRIVGVRGRKPSANRTNWRKGA
jgi:hypothetical protein